MTNDGLKGSSPAEDAKEFSIRQVWLRNVTFNAPGVPEMHYQRGNIDYFDNLVFSIRSAVRRFPLLQDRYELALHVDIRGTYGDETFLTAAMEEIGIFQVSGYTEDEAESLLRSKGVEIMYPFARELVLSMLGRCGIQQVGLRPLNAEVLAELTGEDS